MTDKKTEALRLALKRAFNLGQTYWQQADSEYTSQWKKADVTLASFNQLVEDTIREALAESRSDEEQPAQQDIPKIGCVNHDCDKCKAQQQELASASVEPVAEVRCDDGGNLTAHFYVRDLPLLSKLYTSPPNVPTARASQRSVKPWVQATTWRGLTDEDGIEYPYPPAKPPIYATAKNTKAVRDGFEMGGYEKEAGYYSEAQLDEFARAIEAKLKAKNSL